MQCRDKSASRYKTRNPKHADGGARLSLDIAIPLGQMIQQGEEGRNEDPDGKKQASIGSSA